MGYKVKYSFKKYIYFQILEALNDTYLLLVLFPLRIVDIIFTRDFRDMAPYARAVVFDHLNLVKTHRVNLQIWFKNGRLSIKATTWYSDYLEILAEYKKQKFKSIDQFLNFILVMLQDCFYLTILNNKTGTKTIDLSAYQGSICLIYPITQATKNGEYIDEVVNLLKLKGFQEYKRQNSHAFIYQTYTLFKEKDGQIALTANFGNNLDLTKEFVKEVYLNIFKEKKIPSLRL